MNRNKLLGLMTEAGFSQQTLAIAVGISENSMSNKVNGRRAFTIPEAKRICDILGISDPAERGSIFLEENKPKQEGAGVLAPDLKQITVLDIATDEEIAVITNEAITTAGDHIVVKLTPSAD